MSPQQLKAKPARYFLHSLKKIKPSNLTRMEIGLKHDLTVASYVQDLDGRIAVRIK